MFDSSKKLSVMHLRASNFYGGPERQLHRHALLAEGCGLLITIASFSENGLMPEFLEVIGRDKVRTHCFMVRGAYDFSIVRRIRRHLLENRIDILCTHDYRTQIIGYFAARGSETSWVAFSRGATTENFKVRLYQKIAAHFIRSAEMVVAVSESEKRRLLKMGVNESNIAVVHNAIDTRILEEAPTVDLRERFGFPRDSIICISAGRFSSEKGQIFLARAAHEAIKSNERLRFVMFGDGLELQAVRNYISESDCQDKIRCPGFEKNLLGCLKGADLLVNASLSEGLPNIVLEAMAQKIPIIATSVGGVPELIHQGDSGILVPPGDARALANAILKLVEFWPLRDKLVQSAYATIKESFTFDRQLKKLTDVYEMAVGKRGAAIAR